MLDPPRLGRKLRLARSPWARARAPSHPTTSPRTQVPSRPTPLGSSAIIASPEPQYRSLASNTRRPYL